MQQRILGITGARTVALQSLFCWKFVCNEVFLAIDRERNMLQSLFCWKVVCNRYQVKCKFCAHLLQSLFCWKVVCNRTLLVLS